MEDKDSKPTLAAGMAKRSLWMAIIGGLLGYVCRIEAFGNTAQGCLGLLALALLLISCVFALIALIRVSAEDRDAVLLPGLVGLFIGICCTVGMFRWNSHVWGRARAKLLQEQSGSPNWQPVVVTTVRPPTETQAPVNGTQEPASVIKYELPDLDRIPGLALKVRADANSHNGEDAAVLRAWAAHLERIHAVYTNALAATTRLQNAGLLDYESFKSDDDNEGIRRRGIANNSSEAWRELAQAVSTFSGSFYEDLRKEQVSPARTGFEGKAIMSFVQSPAGAARIGLLRKYCEAQEQVGRNYNYATSKVLDYVRIMRNSPAAGPGYKKQLDDELLKLKQAEQSAAQARGEVFTAPSPKL